MFEATRGSVTQIQRWFADNIKNIIMWEFKAGEEMAKQGDCDDVQEITAFWKYIFLRKSLSQTNISKRRPGKLLFS